MHSEYFSSLVGSGCCSGCPPRRAWRRGLQVGLHFPAAPGHRWTARCWLLASSGRSMWIAPLEVMVGSAMSGTPLARSQLAHSSSSWVGLPLGRVVVATEVRPDGVAQAGHVRGAGTSARRRRPTAASTATTASPPDPNTALSYCASLWLCPVALSSRGVVRQWNKAGVKARTFYPIFMLGMRRCPHEIARRRGPAGNGRLHRPQPSPRGHGRRCRL